MERNVASLELRHERRVWLTAEDAACSLQEDRRRVTFRYRHIGTLAHANTNQAIPRWSRDPMRSFVYCTVGNLLNELLPERIERRATVLLEEVRRITALTQSNIQSDQETLGFSQFQPI